ncbi:uncharacterized protein LOC123430120 [Hordeum vulgare subsp. vulgare]|uniref:uncharacterized protein LOC123430120 n=1 Tax=Hordeum vulgare subsp. vulgare TaxID=112509 RepID=UPI000B4873E1|nr:uncharacterized protein LOC123430120 [Hordeum vulgare subsp. vulgare]
MPAPFLYSAISRSPTGPRRSAPPPSFALPATEMPRSSPQYPPSVAAVGAHLPALPELRLLPGWMHRAALISAVAEASSEVAGAVLANAGVDALSLSREREQEVEEGGAGGERRETCQVGPDPTCQCKRHPTPWISGSVLSGIRFRF